MREIGKPKPEYDHDNMVRLIEALPIPQKNKALVKKWDLELFAKGNKVSSRTQYLQSIYNLMRWQPEKELMAFSRADLMKFKQHLSTATYSRNGSKERPYATTTIESYLSAVREFYRWQEKDKLMDWFKTKRRVRGRLRAEQILSQQDILKLVTAANSKRDKAAIFCLWESGCRASEFLNIKIGDLHFDENCVHFTVAGKTGERQCYIVSSLPTLLEYLEVHPFKNKKDAWLWVKWKGQRLNINGLQRMLRETVKRTDLSKPVFPHALRHSRCTFTAKQGLNEMMMRRLFGWSRTSEMPSIYISLSGKDEKNAVLELSGIKAEEKEQPIQPKKCVRCGTVAPVDAMVCKRCFFPLSAEAAAELQEQAKIQRGMLQQASQKDFDNMAKKFMQGQGIDLAKLKK